MRISPSDEVPTLIVISAAVVPVVAVVASTVPVIAPVALVVASAVVVMASVAADVTSTVPVIASVAAVVASSVTSVVVAASVATSEQVTSARIPVKCMNEISISSQTNPQIVSVLR
jgi:hypothetical protein